MYNIKFNMPLQVVIDSTSSKAEEPCIEEAGLSNSSADREGSSSKKPSNRRRKTTPAGAIVVSYNPGDAKQTPKQSAVDVAEVSTTHLNYRSVFVSDISMQEVIGDTAPSFGEELARMYPAELYSCCTQLDDYFRNGFLIYLEKVRLVAQYQVQLSERSNSIMELWRSE
jgi:hypothetical protein